MSNSSLDVYNQSFLLNLRDGTQIPFSLQDLDSWYSEAIVLCIEYASQLGASVLLLIILFLLTKPGKRISPLYLLNSAALVINILRMVLICLYFNGPFSEIYNFLSYDFSTVPSSAYGVSIAAVIFGALLSVVVLISLTMQVQVVCVSFRRKYRLGLLVSSSCVAGGAMAARLYLAVINIRDILYPDTPTVGLAGIQKSSNIVMTVAIFWFSAVFVIKLGYVLYQRRKLGLRRWGSMQIIFTMGCQTLFIPAIFSLLQDNVDLPGLGSFELTLVTLFLPLSSLWAGAANDGNAKPGIMFNSNRKTVSASRSGTSESTKKLSVSFGSSTQCTSDFESGGNKYSGTHELV